MAKTVLNLGLRLLLVCAIAATALGFTYSLVEERITEQERRQRAEAAEAVLASIGASPQEDTELLSSLQAEFADLTGVFVGVDEAGVASGYAFIIKSKGYNFLTMAVGVDAEGRVTGIKVVTNNETPGLGAAIAESQDFLGQFTGQGPAPLELGREIDGISSATYTCRGITDGVNRALKIWFHIMEKA